MTPNQTDTLIRDLRAQLAAALKERDEARDDINRAVDIYRKFTVGCPYGTAVEIVEDAASSLKLLNDQLLEVIACAERAESEAACAIGLRLANERLTTQRDEALGSEKIWRACCDHFEKERDAADARAERAEAALKTHPVVVGGFGKVEQSLAALPDPTADDLARELVAMRARAEKAESDVGDLHAQIEGLVATVDGVTDQRDEAEALLVEIEQRGVPLIQSVRALLEKRGKL